MLEVLLLATVALATQVEQGEVPCPIGGSPTEVHRLLSQNTHGGWDSDGARYSTRGQFRTYALATCPDNGLTLYGQDMVRGLDPDDQRAVQPVLDALGPSAADVAGRPPWERYRLAARLYRALGRDGLRVARVYLEGTWTVRDAAVGVYNGLNGPFTARVLLEGGALELDKDLVPQARKNLLFNLAKIAHRGGYAADRDRHLAALRALGDLDEGEGATIDAIERAAAVEPTLQDEAIRELRAFLASKPLGIQAAEARYLLADLSRRRGITAEAATLFHEVERDDAAPDQLRTLAGFLGAELRGERPWEQKRYQRDFGPP